MSLSVFSRDIDRGLADYAPGMGEYLEAVLAGDPDERDASALCGADGERRGRGYGDNEGAADARGLLHHLDRDAAGEHHHSGMAGGAGDGQRTAELVKRVVTSDVLAQGDDATFGSEEGRGMHGSRLAVQGLQRRQLTERCHDLGRGE